MIIYAITQVTSFYRDIYRGVTVADLDQQQALAHRLEYVQSALYPMRVDPLANCSDIDPFVPWFLACNEQRFPYWYGHPDPRNTAFLDALGETNKDMGTKKLFLTEGCFDEALSNDHPCLESWIKVKSNTTDPGAGVWARRVKVRVGSDLDKSLRNRRNKKIVDKMPESFKMP